MRFLIGKGLALLVTLVGVSGCNAPAFPKRSIETAEIPDRIADFQVLYSRNCAGCHGQDGKGGAALAINDPTYLAIADDLVLHTAIEKGIRGTAMPAFGQSAGGMLTREQVEILVRGIRQHWARPDQLQGVTVPSRVASTTGDATRGLVTFRRYCSSCHGVDGAGGKSASSIVDPSFLSLVNDQELRTLVLVGRPELGAPDWRGNVLGQPMSDQEISDVVAWLSSKRSSFTDESAGVSPNESGGEK
jgi:cytochrome c oxidase cbb3-type subunit 3